MIKISRVSFGFFLVFFSGFFSLSVMSGQEKKPDEITLNHLAPEERRALKVFLEYYLARLKGDTFWELNCSPQMNTDSYLRLGLVISLPQAYQDKLPPHDRNWNWNQSRGKKIIDVDSGLKIAFFKCFTRNHQGITEPTLHTVWIAQFFYEDAKGNLNFQNSALWCQRLHGQEVDTLVPDASQVQDLVKDIVAEGQRQFIENIIAECEQKEFFLYIENWISTILISDIE